VCNAYPYTSALDVYIGRTKLTKKPLAYKHCGEFNPTLEVGDKVDFKVEDSSAGTFTISDLPKSDAVLLMVIYRHDTLSTAVSFESHVFANLASAQIAVLDTYKGVAKSELHIQDMGQAGQANSFRKEKLRYDNVVAVDPGIYEVLLKDPMANVTKSKVELVAVQSEAYVVVRCGVEAQVGTAYPQELMVYPHSDKRELGAAVHAQPFHMVTVLALLATLLVVLQ